MVTCILKINLKFRTHRLFEYGLIITILSAVKVFNASGKRNLFFWAVGPCALRPRKKTLDKPGNNATTKYGYYGKAAAWNVGDVHMNGGAGQMNTVYSWGTLKEAKIISDMDTAVIK